MKHAGHIQVAHVSSAAGYLVHRIDSGYGDSDDIHAVPLTRLPPGLAGGVQDGFDDLPVAGAAADVALHVLFNFLFAGPGDFVQQRLGGQNHPRCAKAALKSAVVDKGLLYGMEAVTIGHTLDGKHFGVPRLVSQVSAGADRLPVYQDSASAADLQVAGTFGPLEAKPVPDQVQERQLRRDVQGDSTPVDRKLDGDAFAVPVVSPSI